MSYVTGTGSNDTLFGGAFGATNLVTNGSFEQFGAFTSFDGGRYLETADLTGWSITGAPAVQLIANSPFAASDGSRWIDADYSSTNMALSQAVAGLADGAIYRLSIDFGYYAGGGGVVRVSFGGQTLWDVSSAAVWSTISLDVIGGSGDGSNLLSIAEIGDPGAFGGGYDNVRVFALDADGDDTIDGAGGADRMAGGRGDDTYLVDDSGDLVIEGVGEGHDRVEASVSTNLTDNVEDLTLAGSGNLKGYGNALANLLVGNAGRNKLRGDDGDDTINGGDGRDVITGGRGADLISGGAGGDSFRYGSRKDGGDTILDFTPGRDVFEISAASFGGDLVAGMDIGATGRFAATADGQATIAGSQFVLNTATAELVFDANGIDTGQRILIAVLNTTAITAADFVIY